MKSVYLIKGFCTVFFIFVIFVCRGQFNNSGFLSSNFYETRIENLRMEYGNKKTIAPELELECLTALSFYPELKNTVITFRFASPMSTMISQPEPAFLFKNKNRREYLIKMRKPGIDHRGLDLSELSFNAIVGWIGHELAHILYYEHKTNGGVLFTGIKYLFPGFRKKFERFTDQLAIQQQLGYSLYEGTDYVINCSNATSQYKKYMQKYYLSPTEIIEKNAMKAYIEARYSKTTFLQTKEQYD